MANLGNIVGFVPTRMIDGSPLDIQTVQMVCLAANGTALYKGDALAFDTFSSTGNNNIQSGVSYLPCVTQLAAGSSTPTAGIVSSVDPYIGLVPGAENPYILYRPASTFRVINVLSDRRLVYRCMVTSGGSASSVSGAQLQNKNVDVYVGSGSNTTAISGMSIDISTAATTATLPFKIVGWHKRVGVDPSANSAEIEVIHNSAAYMTLVSD